MPGAWLVLHRWTRGASAGEAPQGTANWRKAPQSTRNLGIVRLPRARAQSGPRPPGLVSVVGLGGDPATKLPASVREYYGGTEIKPGGLILACSVLPARRGRVCGGCGLDSGCGPHGYASGARARIPAHLSSLLCLGVLILIYFVVFVTLWVSDLSASTTDPTVNDRADIFSIKE